MDTAHLLHSLLSMQMKDLHCAHCSPLPFSHCSQELNTPNCNTQVGRKKITLSMLISKKRKVTVNFGPPGMHLDVFNYANLKNISSSWFSQSSTLKVVNETPGKPQLRRLTNGYIMRWPPIWTTAFSCCPHQRITLLTLYTHVLGVTWHSKFSFVLNGRVAPTISLCWEGRFGHIPQ